LRYGIQRSTWRESLVVNRDRPDSNLEPVVPKVGAQRLGRSLLHSTNALAARPWRIRNSAPAYSLSRFYGKLASDADRFRTGYRASCHKNGLEHHACVSPAGGMITKYLPQEEKSLSWNLFKAVAATAADQWMERARIIRSVLGMPRPHFIEARFRQRFARLSVPPKSVVKCVESMSRMSPARCSFGGIQSRQLNSLFPAAVKGCGRSGSMS
jgi:hypothetical protein